MAKKKNPVQEGLGYLDGHDWGTLAATYNTIVDGIQYRREVYQVVAEGTGAPPVSKKEKNDIHQFSADCDVLRPELTPDGSGGNTVTYFVIYTGIRVSFAKAAATVAVRNGANRSMVTWGEVTFDDLLEVQEYDRIQDGALGELYEIVAVQPGHEDAVSPVTSAWVAHIGKWSGESFV